MSNNIDIIDFKNNAPVLNGSKANSYRREANFKWNLLRTSSLYNIKSFANIAKDAISSIQQGVNDWKSAKNTTKSVSGSIITAINSGKMVAAYAMFEANINIMMPYISGRAETVALPDDEIEIEQYKVGNIYFPVPKGKKMSDIKVTYVEDKYNNVYNFHKIWQECLKPGNDLCFMDIPSFSISGAYMTTDNHLTENELRDLYENPKTTNIEDYVKTYSTTMYPLLFPIRISRGTANATSETNSKITVTYVRTPILVKNKTLQKLAYNGSFSL